MKLNYKSFLLLTGLLVQTFSLFGATKAGNDQLRITTTVTANTAATASNTTDVATNAGNITTNTAAIASNTAGTSPTFQSVYDNETSGQASYTLDAGGYLKIFAPASTTEVFKVDGDSLSVAVYNLTVIGTQTTINSETIDTDGIDIAASSLSVVPLTIEPTSGAGGPMTSNFLEFTNTNGSTTVAFSVDADGNINSTGGKVEGVLIDAKVRAASLSFWKKGTPADGDVFGWFMVPEAMTISKVNASVFTAPDSTALTVGINIREVGGSLASVTTSELSISAAASESAEVSSFDDATWPKGSIIQVVVVTGNASAAELMVAIEGTYDD